MSTWRWSNDSAVKAIFWLFIMMFFSFSFSSFASAGEKINTGWLSDVAIEGYDTVAYHTLQKAIKGSKKFEVKYKDATWRFANLENKKLFEAEPEKYLPQYGGFCAFAVAHDSTAGIDPEVFAIENGKLYLNYSKSVGEKWSANKAEFIEKADANWEHLK